MTAPDPPDDWDTGGPLYTPPPVPEPDRLPYGRFQPMPCSSAGGHYATATPTLDGYVWICRLCKATKTSRETTWRMP